MKAITVLANAKINLTLDITGRRPDGYHEIEMVMQSVGLADTVEIGLRQDGSLTLFCDDPALPQGPENLAGRAALSFFKTAGIANPGVSIRIFKNIPDGAGLGGGSADAAAVILGLDRLLGTNCGEGLLRKAGLSVGADVPFCLRGGTMLARGIGERLDPLPPLPDCFIVIVRPPEKVSTAAAYTAFDRLNAPGHPDTAGMRRALGEGNLVYVAERLSNVLEKASGTRTTRLIKDRMIDSGALGAAMTGSGSAVFGLFTENGRAGECMRSLKTEFDQAFLTAPSASGCIINP